MALNQLASRFKSPDKTEYMVLNWNQSNQLDYGWTHWKLKKDTKQYNKTKGNYVANQEKKDDNDLLLSTRSIHWPGDMFGRNGLWPVTGNTPE